MTKLEDLEIDEVSLVDKGAVKGAKILLYKRDSTGDRDLVSKCLSAVSKGRASDCSREDYEGALDELAKERADKTGETFHRSYTRVLETDEGQQLYRGLVSFDPSAKDVLA